MIVDASLVIDAVADPGPQGRAARAALAAQPPAETLVAPGHFAFEITSGLRAAVNRPGHPLTETDVAAALADAEAFEIVIEATPWNDVRRGWELSQASLRYADAVYVAAAERHHTTLLTTDGRIERAGAHVTCPIITIVAQ
ncbi:MAG: PIN domain-containing protein [Actinomycetota bacterium]|nr:PIN domain-containing protein [Actinomycetota bacterium]